MSPSESNFRQTVDEGIARMWARRQAEQKLAEAAREYPEMAAREMLPPDSASEPNASFVPHFKNGNLS